MKTLNFLSDKDFPPLGTPLSLTVRDLVAVRDLYHVPLSLMPNVIGTAIGLYRLRIPDSEHPGDRKGFLPREKKLGARTLFNSRVTEDSHPAILVFVRQWIPVQDLPSDPRFIIPQYLYLPDGRAAPTCVIQLDLDTEFNKTPPDPGWISFPENLIGGGCGVYTNVQGRNHVGTVACLMTDGERFYGLTARHVAGPAGQPVYTRMWGKEKCIGVSDSIQVKKKPLTEMYPEYSGGDAFMTLDAGLIRIDEADLWTSQVLNIGELDDLVDLRPANITLEMIGTPLQGSGALSSDPLRGEISALFPRYRGMGGVDYLADLLIGPRPDQKPGEFQVLGGDSGSLWVFVKNEDPGKTGLPRAKPVAITWGVIDLAGGGVSRQLVLASFISTICKTLELEVVTQQNIGYRPVWGADNHKTFARIIADLLTRLEGTFQQFLLGKDGDKAERIDALQQLAVLPDDWRYKPGRSDEGPNHYADIDKTVAGTRLADVEFTHAAWKDFYYKWEEEEPGTGVKFGALPFRIGQVFDCLVEYIKQQNYEWVFAAAGALIHYVADACNPAHVTLWTAGDPAWTKSQHSRFHGIWDKECLIDEARVLSILDNADISSGILDGKDASAKALQLMKQTLNIIPVGDFVTTNNTSLSYKECKDFINSPQGQDKITSVVTGGCKLLLSLWQSAWLLGSSDVIDPNASAGLNFKGLHDKLLWQKDFLPSISLVEMTE